MLVVEEKSMGITKVIMIHPLGAMNVCLNLSGGLNEAAIPRATPLAQLNSGIKYCLFIFLRKSHPKYLQ